MNEDLQAKDRRRAWWILGMNTFAFTVCFAAWMMNGVLITFLLDNRVHHSGPAQIGWLIRIPVLSAAIFRLSLGITSTSAWSRAARQGTALEIFAAGIARAAITVMEARRLLSILPDGGNNPDGSRMLPHHCYA